MNFKRFCLKGQAWNIRLMDLFEHKIGNLLFQLAAEFLRGAFEVIILGKIQKKNMFVSDFLRNLVFKDILHDFVV